MNTPRVINKTGFIAQRPINLVHLHTFMTAMLQHPIFYQATSLTNTLKNGYLPLLPRLGSVVPAARLFAANVLMLILWDWDLASVLTETAELNHQNVTADQTPTTG